MGLFGALFSGVSGLVAQSSAMSAVSDNITNVNTVGYKNVEVDFQTLVTKQTSVTFFSAGGVQSRPKQANDVQGLLQASTSQTDIGVSGAGFFVVNEVSQPTINDQFLFSRAGSFFQDDEGFLRNTAGFYLQAWPVDQLGNVIPANDALLIANQNVISTDFLETVNLSRVGGTAAETTEIAIGANLPSNATTNQTHRTDVQFFDTLGNPNSISFVYTKSATANEWDLAIDPPIGVHVQTLYDANNNVFDSRGHLEFQTVPTAGEVVVINGRSYGFGGAGGDVSVTASTTVAGTVANLVAAVQADGANTFGAADNLIKVSDVSTSIAVFGNLQTGGATYTVDATGLTAGTVAQTQTLSILNRQVADGTNAIVFDADGLPSSFNVAEIELLDFVNGASDMDNDLVNNAARIDLDFGTIGEANGLTQFGTEFTPTFIQQDGAQFGTFAGVTIDSDGLMTALFDNGELRPIFKIPLATFVNPNGLEARTGNAYNATQRSGDPTLRVPDNGPAGQVIQAALESSTVDIGSEFTAMIIIQRAYSAATKIISTADQMLEELTRIR